MAEPRTTVNREELVRGRHPAGRTGEKTSSGRHGRKPLSEDITGEEGTETKTRGRRLLEAVGKTAVVVLACGVGSVVVACTEVGALKDVDAGWEDTESDTDTEEIDTDTDTDTEPLGPECGVYNAEDNEAALGMEEMELLGPVGHWMKVVDLAFNGQLAEVVLRNEQWEPVDFEGNVVDEELASHYIFSAENPTLTVSMGGLEQTITLCGVHNTGDGTLVAHFITDNEDGFMHCAYVNSGSLSGPVLHEFSEEITQLVSVHSHNHGFIPDVETGLDPECPGSVSTFKFERTEFEPALSSGYASVPGETPYPLKMRGTTQKFIDVGQDEDGKYIRIAKTSANKVLLPFESVSCSFLTATWAGVAWDGAPLFSYEYPGATYIAEEIISQEERKVYVWVGSTVKEFVLKHPEPLPFGTSGQQGLGASLFANVQELRDGEAVKIGSTEYIVFLNTENQRISGFELTPATE